MRRARFLAFLVAVSTQNVVQDGALTPRVGMEALERFGQQIIPDDGGLRLWSWEPPSRRECHLPGDAR